ncbi:Esterase/lipase [Pelagirhabdus alkalitolerans]|uniref:Esterase/lipase n=1 Tax=Pelagirhabdus alkalitolerans TaxID=1612202 RepID=A0A1G6JGC6_9BACI|nr:alpha/beta fold hydrolase [Pelagirhabdus alkalitolerans]SDC17505.1 Esterase/lipase [Pelagirhabdus alkalitolerans]
MIGCLCIHGFTGAPYEIEPLTEHLKKKTNWMMRIPTLPGHGIELDLDNVNYEAWLETAEKAYSELREQVDVIYLIGFSMGGMISAYLAAKYGADRLVMLSPSRKYLSLSKMSVEVSQLIKDRIMGEIEDNFTYQNYKHKQGLIPVRSYVEFIKCMNETKKYLSDVTCPTLVLQGIQDGLVPYRSTHYLDEEISGPVDVIYYADSKHLICLGDDQHVVIDAVFNFLS